MQIIISTLSNLLIWLNPSVAEGPVVLLDVPKEFQSTWYLSPDQHAAEILLYTIGVVPALLLTFYLAGKHPLLMSFPTTPRGQGVSLTGVVLGCSALCSYTMHAYFKYFMSVSSWRFPYMLQPCHMLVLIFGIIVLSKKTKFTEGVFIVATPLTWSAVVAFLFPDLSDYEHPFDILNYYIEHLLILVIPFYLVSSGRYMLVQSKTSLALSYLTMCLYHVFILMPAAIISHVNLATLMSPPSEIACFGKWYRPCQFLIVLVGHTLYNHFFLNRWLLSWGTWTWEKHALVRSRDD